MFCACLFPSLPLSGCFLLILRVSCWSHFCQEVPPHTHPDPCPFPLQLAASAVHHAAPESGGGAQASLCPHTGHWPVASGGKSADAYCMNERMDGDCPGRAASLECDDFLPPFHPYSLFHLCLLSLPQNCERLGLRSTKARPGLDLGKERAVQAPRGLLVPLPGHARPTLPGGSGRSYRSAETCRLPNPPGTCHLWGQTLLPISPWSL